MDRRAVLIMRAGLHLSAWGGGVAGGRIAYTCAHSHAANL